MLSATSNHIINLYNNKNYQYAVVNIISKVIRHVGITKHNIMNIIKFYISEKNSDKKIIEALRNLVIKPDKPYSMKENMERASRKWQYIKPQLENISVNAMLDYGGGVGDAAYMIGRNILKLKKENTFVIDVDEFGGFKYIPRDDITFIHFDNMNQMKAQVEFITVSHVMHHINYQQYPLIISLFNRILSKDGIIMLYEHDCSSNQMAAIINIEHCLYDVVNSKKLTYNGFIKDFYAKYINIEDWITIFSKYFKPIKIIKLNNADNSFYMFLSRNNEKINNNKNS
jgi:hypothetical protein